MRMPILSYFVVVGAALFAVLVLASSQVTKHFGHTGFSNGRASGAFQSSVRRPTIENRRLTGHTFAEPPKQCAGRLAILRCLSTTKIWNFAQLFQNSQNIPGYHSQSGYKPTCYAGKERVENGF
jgi:hypothetical protein